ncbi:hypothetical protein CCACVL1_03666 [Corchorus capsularis]|uniref:Uncharacterized protein n=1 Tax=Corchorus capsularis TaxID=210143 RepID=A0A1R3JY24_COCAP|nr:hypothetical protein CCACVL1_03666 [Corchorus capsularis]
MEAGIEPERLLVLNSRSVEAYGLSNDQAKLRSTTSKNFNAIEANGLKGNGSVIKSGADTSFWHDNWTSAGCLRSKIQGPF